MDFISIYIVCLTSVHRYRDSKNDNLRRNPIYRAFVQQQTETIMDNKTSLKLFWANLHI